ncbi:unnamed protein product, partial [marine sediment metagenome]
YKLEFLCQLLKSRFEAKVSFGGTLSFLVRRLFVAQNGSLLRYIRHALLTP